MTTRLKADADSFIVAGSPEKDQPACMCDVYADPLPHYSLYSVPLLVSHQSFRPGTTRAGCFSRRSDSGNHPIASFFRRFFFVGHPIRWDDIQDEQEKTN